MKLGRTYYRLFILTLFCILFYMYPYRQQDNSSVSVTDSPPAWPNAKKVKLALVVPFAGWQSDLVLRNLQEIWLVNTPCLSTSPTYQADLFLYFHRDITLSGHLIPLIREAFYANSRLSSCFSSLQFLNAGLTEAQDFYPLAAARMFFKLFHFSKLSEYTVMYYMEPDNLPCQPGWLDAIVTESLVPNSGFWLRGSIIRDRDPSTGEYAYAQHINGNALYAINNPFFKEFLRKVERRFWQDPELYLGGYDVAIYMIRHERDWFTWLEYTSTVHYFQYTNLVQNVYRTPMNATEVCLEDKNTFLVHGREVYL